MNGVPSSEQMECSIRVQPMPRVFTRVKNMKVRPKFTIHIRLMPTGYKVERFSDGNISAKTAQEFAPYPNCSHTRGQWLTVV